MTRDEIIKEAEEFQIKHELEMEMAAHKGIAPYISSNDFIRALQHIRSLIALVPKEGEVVVPEEPTTRIINAGVAADDMRTGYETVKHIYIAMIEANKK